MWIKTGHQESKKASSQIARSLDFTKAANGT